MTIIKFRLKIDAKTIPLNSCLKLKSVQYFLKEVLINYVHGLSAVDHLNQNE